MRSVDHAQSRAHWDALAASYDAAKDRNDAYYAALQSCFARFIPLSARRRILEIGCGTGRVLASLSPAEGVGTDVSASMIDAARARHHANSALRFEVEDGAAQSDLGQFDAVISADVLEHVPDWRSVLVAMVRRAAPGGLIICSTPNPRWTLPLYLLEKMHLKMPEGPHRFVPLRHIEHHLRAAGATITHASTHLILPARLGGLGPALSRRVENWPLLRGLGVIQLIAARRPPT